MSPRAVFPPSPSPPPPHDPDHHERERARLQDTSYAAFLARDARRTRERRITALWLLLLTVVGLLASLMHTN